jgi:DNA-binding CsgD family transcriptional regulator
VADLIGRDAALRDARSALGAGRAVAIVGPAGIGKTALARAVVGGGQPDTPVRSATDVPAVLWATATRSAASVAFGALAPLLQVAAAESVVTPSPGSAAESLRATAPDSVVVVDDVHLLDDASSALVVQLVRGGHPVLLTCRSEEQSAVIDALLSGRLVELIELGPLDPDDVRAQVESLLAAPVDAGGAHRLHHLSAGVPLYVREIVLAGLAEGWLDRSEDRYRIDQGSMPRATRLRHLIEHRLADCSAEELVLLEAVALAERLEMAAAVALSGAEIVERLVWRQLLAVQLEGTARVVVLDHPVIGEVCRAGLGELRARQRADALLEVLADLPDPSPERTLRLGLLAERASDPDPRLLLDAASAAGARHDFAAALRFARQSRDRGGGIAAELAVAEALTAAGAYEEAEATARALLASAELGSGDRARAVAGLATALFWGLGRTEEAEGALRGAEVDPADRVSLDAHLAFLLVGRGRIDDALAVATPLIAPEVPRPVRLLAASAAAAALALKARSDQAEALVEEHLELALAEVVAAPRAVPELLAGRLVAQWLGGRPRAMVDAAAELLQGALELGDAEAEGPALLVVALAHQARGHLPPAIEAADAALAALARHDTARLAGWAHALRAHLASIVGDLASAQDHLARSEEPPLAALSTFDHDRIMARVRIAAHRGERRSAIAVALDGAARMRMVGRDGSEALLLDLAARLGHGAAADRLAELAAVAEGDLVPALAEHADALAAGDPDRLLAVADRFEEIGDDLAAADAASGAVRAALRLGRQGTAGAAARRAAALLGRTGGATLAQPLPAPGVVVELTERELDVAVLAGQGHSNKEVAAMLGLSVRTVGNHLYRVYAKAGVEGRAGLAEVLRNAGYLAER